MERKNKLVIPHYLNQKIVFDMLAIIEDGFSQMTTINRTNSKSTDTSGSIDGEIGTANIFSLLNVKMKGSFNSNRQNESGEEESLEKVHTPTSLFEKLLSTLEQDGLIKDIRSKNDLEELKNGSFVRFQGSLRQNPLILMMDSFIKLFELMTILSKDNSKKDAKKKNDENKVIMGQMKSLREGLSSGDISDIICDIDESNVKAVLQVSKNYFYNYSMSEIIDGEYKVIGKVVKIVNNDSDSINLLRNTSFSSIKMSVLDGIFKSFDTGEMDKFFSIPEIEICIEQPSIMIVPIAIYT